MRILATVVLCLWYSGASTAAAQVIVAAECAPSCRDGFVCSAGACVDACNPGCGPGTRCSTSGTVHCEPISPGGEPEPAAPATDRQANGGMSIAFLAGGGYSFAYMPLDTAGGDGPSSGIAAYGHLGWLGGGFDLQYGFSDVVYFGITLDVARFVNSDDSSGTAMRMGFGVSLLIRPVRAFYLGIDAVAQYQSFDDIPPEFEGYRIVPDTNPHMDAAHTLGIAARLRLGFVIQVTDLLAITPELRFGAMPYAFVLDGADASDHLGGGVDGDATNLVTASAGLYLGSRLFF